LRRTSRALITLLLIVSLSFTTAFATGEAQTEQTNGVYKVNGAYYYKDSAGKIRTSAGFINWNGDKYYIEKGGKIASGKTFTVGKNQYRAFGNGKIAVGVYKWGGKLYYSEPSSGAWVKIKSHRCQKGVAWKGNWYFLQTNSQVATNRPVVINNLPYVANADGICTPIGVNPTKNKVLIIARKQLGKHTKAQVKPFWKWCHRSKFVDTDRTPWCASFVGWCYKKAGMYKKIRRVGNKGYVPSYSKFANKKHKWVNKYKAKDGDIIIFGNSQHTGIVERVYNGYIYTIEGNSGPTAEVGTRKPGAVTRRVYKLTDKYIKGVMRP
jgi:hypothetical protein